MGYARLVALDTPHAAWRRLAGAGDSDVGSRRRVVLARLAWLARPPGIHRPATWYGYAAFALALPYPVLRTSWALGGRSGSCGPARRDGWAPWLACIPWLLAAALSLLLVPTWRWMPRRLLLAAGWFATAVVAMVGPAACWSLVSKLVVGGDLGLSKLASRPGFLASSTAPGSSGP